MWFLTTEAGIEISHLIGAITEKPRFRDKEIAGLEGRILAKEARLRSLWNGCLEHQMEVQLPYNEVFRTVRRKLRQAKLPQ